MMDAAHALWNVLNVVGFRCREYTGSIRSADDRKAGWLERGSV